MKSRLLFGAIIFVAMICCGALAQDGINQPANPDCPVQRTMGFMGNLFQSMSNGISSGVDSIRSSTSSLSLSSSDATTRIKRRRRQTNTLSSVEPMQQQQVVPYDQNQQASGYNLQSLIQQARDSPYMPPREQVIQTTTTVLSLMLMSSLGPTLGTNYNIVQPLIKQTLPFIVGAGINYAADYALAPEDKISLDAPITDVQLQPVQPNSAISSF